MFGLPQQQQPKVELPPEDDGGVPLPPGFTTHVTKYSENPAKIEIIVSDLADTLFKSPISNPMAFVIFFFMKNMYFFFNNAVNFITKAVFLFTMAFSKEFPFSNAQRAKVFAGGLISLLLIPITGFFVGIFKVNARTVVEEIPSMFYILEKE